MDTTYQIIWVSAIALVAIAVVPLLVFVMAVIVERFIEWRDKIAPSLTKKQCDTNEVAKEELEVSRQALYLIDEKWLAPWQKEKGSPALTIAVGDFR